MLICLDIGNTHIYGGILNNSTVVKRFRYPTKTPYTSDQLGLFLKAILQNHKIEIDLIKAISICSVVPHLDYSTIAACIKYLQITPYVLTINTKTDIKFIIEGSHKLGADRIANAVGAINLHPKQNLIIIDFGTATTICALSEKKEYLGGAIIPGMKTSLESLCNNAALLSQIQIVAPEESVGEDTETQIQLGLYYSQLGGIKMIVDKLTTKLFQNNIPKVITTGGYAHLFEGQNLFSINEPDLVLQGLRIIFEKNQK